MMKREKNLRMQEEERLKQMFAKGKGSSKHADKANNEGKPSKEKIYVDSTMKTYRQGWNHFCSFLKDMGVSTRNLSIVNCYVQPFIEYMIEKGYSAYTIHTWTAAVVKVLGLPLSDYRMPKRQRQDITRSRLPVKSDAHFSPSNHQDLIAFCRAVGPRNDKELAKIKGSDLFEQEDGSFAVFIAQGKGGKKRYAPICGSSAEVAAVVSMMRVAGEDLVFPHIPDAADIHSFRADYACRVYSAHARPINEIPREDRYICRKDMAGVIYDKRAMMVASKALGHSRLDVIALSYLWALDTSM